MIITIGQAVSVSLPSSAVTCFRNSFKHYLVRDEPVRGTTQYFVGLGDDTHPPITSLEGIMAYFNAKSTGEFQPLNHAIDVNEATYDVYLPGEMIYV